MSDSRKPQLDTIRALAVLLVLYQHTMRPQFILTGDAGAIGVQLFFVLSGFLITGILLDARADAAATRVPLSGVLGRFYIRRFLRIFPLYYALIAVAWILGEPGVRQYVLWLVTYSTNFLMASVGGNIGMPTPFWSLAVEEQFYLFWPFVALFVPTRRLPWVLVGMIVLSIGSRFVIALSGAPGHTITMPTWSALDGLAIGGLLAYAVRTPFDPTVVLRWAAGAGFLLIGMRLGLISIQRFRPIQMALWMFPWGLIAAWVVHLAARGKLPAVFNFRPLAWVGVVSYGVYVYHRPMMSVLQIGVRRGWEVFGLITALTIIVASISWIVFERPINNLKSRWPYVPGARNRPAPVMTPEQSASA